jgi:hypothetical protein
MEVGRGQYGGRCGQNPGRSMLHPGAMPSDPMAGRARGFWDTGEAFPIFRLVELPPPIAEIALGKGGVIDTAAVLINVAENGGGPGLRLRKVSK